MKRFLVLITESLTKYWISLIMHQACQEETCETAEWGIDFHVTLRFEYSVYSILLCWKWKSIWVLQREADRLFMFEESKLCECSDLQTGSSHVENTSKSVRDIFIVSVFRCLVTRRRKDFSVFLCFELTTLLLWSFHKYIFTVHRILEIQLDRVSNDLHCLRQQEMSISSITFAVNVCI